MKRLRDAYADAFRSLDVDDDIEPCPDASVLVDSVRGRLGPATQDSVSEHLDRCPVCLEAYRLAVTSMRPVSSPSLPPG